MIVFTVSEDNKAGLAFIRDLYRRYSRLMYTMARRCVPSYQNCGDIVQDAVESLCKKLHTLMDLPAPALPVYIVYTVKNQAKNFIRHQAVVQKHIVEWNDGCLDSHEAPLPPPETCGPVCRSRIGSSSTGSMFWARVMRSWPRFFNAGKTTSVCG